MDAVAEAIVESLSYDEKRAKAVHASIKNVKEDYSLETQLKNLRAVYKEVLR